MRKDKHVYLKLPVHNDHGLEFRITRMSSICSMYLLQLKNKYIVVEEKANRVVKVNC